MTLRFGIIHPRNFVNFTKCILCAMRDDSQGNYRILKPEFRRARNLGDYEGKPRITRIRADKYIRGDWPIRAYPRNPRLTFVSFVVCFGGRMLPSGPELIGNPPMAGHYSSCLK